MATTKASKNHELKKMEEDEEEEEEEFKHQSSSKFFQQHYPNHIIKFEKNLPISRPAVESWMNVMFGFHAVAQRFQFQFQCQFDPPAA